MDASTLGFMSDHHKWDETFIVVMRNPDGSLSRIKKTGIVYCRFYDDGTFKETDENCEDDEDSAVHPCAMIEADEPGV